MKRCFVFFFFSSRRRHTRLTCDWSSDVCSSDLPWRRDRVGPDTVHARRRADRRRRGRVPDRAPEAAMSTVWIVVLVTGAGTIALKAAGPVLLGGRPLPDRVAGVVTLVGTALLAALVAIGTFADGQRLVIDARVLGVGAAAVALRFHAPVLLVVIIAAAVTATARAFAG